MIKSRDLRDIALSHHQNGGKAPDIAKLLVIKFIEVQLIDGFIDTNNLAQLVLHQNQEDHELVLQ